jgi:hypothetical protein
MQCSATRGMIATRRWFVDLSSAMMEADCNVSAPSITPVAQARQLHIRRGIASTALQTRLLYATMKSAHALSAVTPGSVVNESSHWTCDRVQPQKELSVCPPTMAAQAFAVLVLSRGL